MLLAAGSISLSSVLTPLVYETGSNVIAFLAMFEGVRLLGASQTGLLMNLEPVLTILLALLVLHESLSPLQLLGAVLVISAVLTAQRFGTVRAPGTA